MRPWASALLPAALTSVCARASGFLPRFPSAVGKVAFVSTAAAVRSLGLRCSRPRRQWRHSAANRCISLLAAGNNSGCFLGHQQSCRGSLRQRPGVATGVSTLLASGRRRRRRTSSMGSSGASDDSRAGGCNSNPAADLVSEDTLTAWPPALSPTSKGIGLAEAVKQAAQWLDIHGVVDPEPSASELLAKAAGFRSPQDMLSQQQQQQSPGYSGQEGAPIELSAAAWDDFRRLCVLRAAQHVPVQYLVGEWDFYGLSLEMKPPTLIPRPETEELVEIILGWLRQHVLKASGMGAGEGALRFLDVGSGTGAIGLALLNELPAEARCVAIDTQESAVRLSRRNAERTGLKDRYVCFHAQVAEFGVELGPADASGPRNRPRVAAGGVAREESGAAGDSTSSLEDRAGWSISTSDVQGGFDFIVSNPPYIPRKDMKVLPRDVADHEDSVALDGGEDGLDVVRDIVGRCPRLLRSGGPRQLWMEVDTSHPEAIQRWLGLPVGLGGDGVGGGSQECQAQGVTRLEWMRDMSQRPRFVRLTFAEEDARK